MARRRWHLYTLVDPAEPGRPRYVGVTSNLVNRRHVHTVRRSCVNPRLRAWKAALLDAGRAPRLRVLEVFGDPIAAREREWRLVHRWRRRGLCDLNVAGYSTKPFALMCAAKAQRVPRKCNQGATETGAIGISGPDWPETCSLTPPIVAQG